MAAALLRQHSKPAPRAPPRETAVQRLLYSWAEVSLLLRDPLEDQEAYENLKLRARAAQNFIDLVSLVCERLSIAKGHFARLLLPYNDDTSVSDQAASARSLAELELAKEPELVEPVDAFLQRHRGAVAYEAVGRDVDCSNFTCCTDLVIAATALRQLVRVKIADENDLGQAETAVQQILKFTSTLGDALAKLHSGEFSDEVAKVRAELEEKQEENVDDALNELDAYHWSQLDVPFGMKEFAFIQAHLE
jgi:hypothetical protein